MGNEEKTIAVVSHPGNGAGDIAASLPGDGGFIWRAMPGVHMLGRNTAGEQTTYDYLLGRGEEAPPDGILAVVHANELPRQLYLLSQLLDLRLPLVVGLVAMEEAMQVGLSINVEKLSAQFGVSFIPLNLSTRDGFDALGTGLSEAFEDQDAKKPLHWRPSVALADAYNVLDTKWIYKHLRLHSGARLIEGLRILSVAKAIEEYEGHPAYNELVRLVEEARALLESKNENWTMAEVLVRNNWINQILASSTSREEQPAAKKGSFWDRIKATLK